MRRWSMPCRRRWRSAPLVGLVNGLGIVALGISPIVMTLAMNGILQGVALVYSGGTPDGFASPWPALVHDRRNVAGVTPVVFLMVLFVVGAVVLLGRTAFGRRVYAIGNGVRAAELSGVPVERDARQGLYPVRPLRGAGRLPAVRAFPARAASAWATNTCCPRSPSSWSAAR